MPKPAIHHLWKTAREYLTHWFVAGAIVALTGFAPDHWFATLFEHIHLPDEFRQLPIPDYRVLAVCLGVAIIVGDALLRNHRKVRPPGEAATDPKLSGYVVDAKPRLSTEGPSLPDKPSIAVLPFHNMSGDQEQEYFVDGMVDEIITALSRFRWLFVIARSSSFIYKGQAADTRRVSGDLGVRYVLEGSLRKDGRRVRVTAQLIDALSGAHLWAERYDRDVIDVFALQDEITASVAAVIEPALAEAERERVLRKPPASLDAWETYQRGLWHFYKFRPDESKTAQLYFRSAIAAHPNFAPGHYGLALAQQLDFWLYSTRSWADVAGSAWLEEARIGVSLDDKDSMAHAILSFAQHWGEWEAAIAEAKAAFNLNPNSVWSMMAMGVALGWGGYPREGIQYLHCAMRASPHDPMTRFWTFWAGIFQYHMRDYAASIVSMREVIRVRSLLDPYALRWIAQALAQLDRLSDAKAELERATNLSPELFNKFVRERPPWCRPDDYAHAIEGLRKAGWMG